MPNPLDFLRRRPATALAAYWLCAAVATHVPPLRRRRELPGLPWDKLVHLLGYAALAWLLMNALTPRRRLGASILLTIALVAGYGALDELTQPPFGRTADLWDYYADLAGLSLGLGLWMSGLRAGDTIKHA